MNTSLLTRVIIVKMAGVLKADQLSAIGNSKVLLVGAGGIGCEVLKCLVQSGFKDIEIVSMSHYIILSLSTNHTKPIIAFCRSIWIPSM